MWTQAHKQGLQAPRSMPEITQPAGSCSVSGIHTRVMYHCTVILPTAGQEPQACSTGYLYVYHRPMLSKHRCCSCQICKTKQQLAWCMCFSTPQLQVTWVCLPSSLSIFCYFPTDGNLFYLHGKTPEVVLSKHYKTSRGWALIACVSTGPKLLHKWGGRTPRPWIFSHSQASSWMLSSRGSGIV